MDELINQILTFAKGAWKHRWLGLLVAWVVGVIGAAVVVRVPDKYEASARIYVDTQSILKPLMSGLAVQPNVDQQIGMLSRTLITRPNVEKLIRMADLDLSGSQSKSTQEGLIDSLMGTLKIGTTGRDNLYVLSFQDPSPEKAKKVVQSLVSIFVESSLGDSRKDTDAAKKFIGEQIKIYEAKLEAAESRLKEFKLKNIDSQTENGPDMAGRLGEINAQYERAKLELREAENARDAARQQLDIEKSQSANLASRSLMQESAQNNATPEIDSRIDAQKRNLDALLQRYTDQHPDVVGARRLIKDLEDQKKKELQELRKIAVSNSGTVTGTSSLAAQELSRVMASSEVQVAALRARVAEYGSRYQKALASMKNAPQIEAEYAQLNRDYAINKKNYEDLVSRRESATLSGDLESAAGVADFRLIDPPRVSPKPVAPNRMLLLLLVLAIAIGAGGFTAFAASQLRPVFHDARSLQNVVDLPLLGIVTLVVSDAVRQKERSDLRRFFVALGGLIICFVLGIMALAFFSGRVGGSLI
ncbi:XrtA system polysaccharide chain length determinant [Variovorax sp. HJSM1_2]|uniref:XrtA system polysaccharide chain length determinant n=1 Tax=Variovorax sp. HJSM1_2 TaxID=3366263 RepID=UPI003BD3591F